MDNIAKLNEPKMEGIETKAGGMMTALWIIAAVIVIGFLFNIWNQSKDRQCEMGVAIGRLSSFADTTGQIVKSNSNRIYNLNGNMNYIDAEVQDLRSRRACGGGGEGRPRFEQKATYKQQGDSEVIVRDDCGRA